MSSEQSQERHLLFGLLACQNEFITHAELLKAFSTWVGDKTTPLDRILVEQGALSAEDRVLFDRLVEKHLSKFNGDAAQSLANLSEVSSIRDDLERAASHDTIMLESISNIPSLRIQESAFGTIIQNDASSFTRTPAPSAANSSKRFRIMRQHARGGLGVVFLAEDKDLHREVAMKQIRDDRADHAGYQLKFMQEAEITGQLEHPGIVPIYALGVDEKGRPYYAMRFIRGEDLQSRIRTFHANRKTYKTEFDGAELRSMLRRFVDVCNAIQYAHDRGVLHRDLKPGNVMLGKHGETLVVDWGLAKPFGNLQPEDVTATVHDFTETPVERTGSSDGSETRDGTFIGTPAYAPPEQVLGQLAKLGPRSDVYSLGGILYELLTGSVPVSGTTVQEVITKATQGEIPSPRSLDAEIPKPLEAVCRKAMATDLEDRYPSAEELCREIERWLDDLPVAAYQEPWLTRTHRFVRKNPVAVTWAAALVLMGLFSAAGYGMVSSSYNRQLLAKNQQIAAEKNAAEVARDAERLAKDAALFARSQAVGVRDFLVDIFRQPDPSRDGRKVTVYESMIAGVQRVRLDFAKDPETSVALLTSIYESYTGLGLYDEANTLIQEVLDLREKNNLDENEDGLRTRNDLGKNLKLLGKYTRSIQTHEAVLADCVEKLGSKSLLTLQVKHDLANAYRAAGRLEDALTTNQEVLAVRGELLSPADPDLLSSQNTLANSLQAIGRPADALEQRIENLSRRRRVLGDNHPDTLASVHNLAISLLELGRLDEALLKQTNAFENRREVLGIEHPDTLISLLSLANILIELGRDEEAELMMIESIEGLKNSLGDTHPSTLAAESGLGRILERQRKYDRSMAVLEKVYAAQLKTLGESHPNTLATLNNLASVFERVGRAERGQDMLETAVDQASEELGLSNEVLIELQLTLEAIYFRNEQVDKGLALCERLAPLATEALGDSHPLSLKARSNLALAYYVVGELSKSLGIYEEMSKIQEHALGAAHPETLRTELGTVNTLRELRRVDQALSLAEMTLAKSRMTLGNDDEFTLDVMDTLGYLYTIAERVADAKELYYEELQTRTKKFGIKDPSTILSAVYLVTVCEQLDDWATVKTVCTKFIAELEGAGEFSNWLQDFRFREGYAMVKSGGSLETAEELMKTSFEAIQAFASPPAPPQLSADVLQMRLHDIYIELERPDEAQRYSVDGQQNRIID